MALSLLPLVLTALVTSPVRSGHRDDVRCLSCTNVAVPEQCVSYEQCNLGEVCFTHEVFDHNGFRSFRLGCESRGLCDIAQSAHLIGRRQTGETTEQTELCFKCCPDDDCNAFLCEEVLDLNRTHTHTSPHGTCPPAFLKGPNSCLYFHDVPVRWTAARESCRKLGGDLVKVDDLDEDLFIVDQLKKQHLPSVARGFWTGGHRDVITNEYVWLDHSPVTYTRWGRGEPNKERNNDMFILYSSPAIFATMPNWEWADYEDKAPYREASSAREISCRRPRCQGRVSFLLQL